MPTLFLLSKRQVSVDWGIWAHPPLTPAQKAAYEALWSV